MKFCFINPPWFFKEEMEFISHNLGIGYIISLLEANGHQVQFIDALVEGIGNKVCVSTKYQKVFRYGLSYEEISEKIERDVDYIGITGPFTDSAAIVRALIGVIKEKHPAKPVIAGGVYPSTLPSWVLDSGADIVVRGEGELAMLRLAEGDRLEDIKGLVFSREGQIVDNGIAELIEDIDTIPFPSYSKRDVDFYFDWSPRGERQSRTASMITSRGCPFSCSFCSIHPVYGRKWRARSPENVLEEIELLVGKYGVTHIEFEDDNFTLQPERTEDILDGIIKINKNKVDGRLTWSAPNGIRLDSLTESLVSKMKDSSCRAICIAVESGDPDILERMNKRLDLNKVEEVIRLFAKYRINSNAFFIIGYPGENEERFLNSVAFAKKLKSCGLTSISPLVATPYPGTSLFSECQEKGYLRYPDVENVLFFAEYSSYSSDFVQIETPDFSVNDIMRRYQYFQDEFGCDGVKYNTY